MADDVRQALEQYRDEWITLVIGYWLDGTPNIEDLPRVAAAPRAFDALRKVLDHHERCDCPFCNGACKACDGLNYPCATVQAILSALTDSPDMEVRDV